MCRAPLDTKHTAVAADGCHIAVGDNFGDAHAFVLLRGDPVPSA